MKRFTFFLTLFLSVSMMLFYGCEKKNDTGKTVIKYMRWADPSELKSTKELMDIFMKENPDIKVEFTTESWGGYWDKLQTQIAAGVGPDVFLIGAYFINDFYNKGIILNLQPFIDRDKIDLNDFFSPPLQLYTFNGNLYGLPRDINSIVLYYNKDIFDREGLAYPNNNWTWDDLVKIGKILTKDLNGDGRIDQWGFMTSSVYEVCWGNFVLQNGGSLLNPSKTRCIANSPEVIGALQFLYDVEHKYKISPTAKGKASLGDYSNVFLTGKIAMITDGSWRMGAFRDAPFKWDITILPKKKYYACIANGIAHVINSRSKHIESAWKLVKFLSDKDAQIALAKSATAIPIRKSVAYSKYFLDGNPEHKINAIESIKYGYNYPATERMSEWLDSALITELELAFLGEKSIKKAMEDAVVKVNKILDEVNSKKKVQ